MTENLDAIKNENYSNCKKKKKCIFAIDLICVYSLGRTQDAICSAGR